MPAHQPWSKHLKRFICSVILLAACTAAIGKQAPPYVLENTEVHDVPAPALKRDYQVFVSLPASYNTSTKRYPVVFVVDANYAFPVVRALAARVGARGKHVEEFILVGLSYGKGDTAEYSRRRDYTPAAWTGKPVTSDIPGRTPQFGESEGYRRYIASEVFPLIASRYRADMNRKIFAGHSYGSLLGLQILFTDPSMFSHYIMGSPSLWYGKYVMLGREKAYAATHKDLKANIYFAVGGLERPAPGVDDDDMVADLRQFAATLQARRYPGLKISTTVFDDEDHLSVAPALLTRGLKWALPPVR
jgi:predicted alpha/beta superfamily hydrolase